MVSGRTTTTRPGATSRAGASTGGYSGTADIAARSRCAKASHTSEGDKITYAIQPPQLHSLRDSKPFVKIIRPLACCAESAPKNPPPIRHHPDTVGPSPTGELSPTARNFPTACAHAVLRPGSVYAAVAHTQTRDRTQKKYSVPVETKPPCIYLCLRYRKPPRCKAILASSFKLIVIAST
jgi:hypothetical protein